MWHVLRKKKTDFVKTYPNDMLAATGKLPLYTEFIRYRITPGITGEYDQWMREVYEYSQKKSSDIFIKKNPAIYFVHAKVNDVGMPMLGLIVSSEDSSGRVYPFSIIRILEHPLAHDFQSIVPWLYRETFSHLHQLFLKSKYIESPYELYQQIDSIRYYNCRLKRRDALEAILTQLRYMSFGHFWDSMRLGMDPAVFVSHTTRLLHYLKQGHYLGIRLPLPNQYDLLPSVVFWMQLLESVCRQKTKTWEIYWHGCDENQQAALLFYQRKLPPEILTKLFDQSLVSNNVADALNISTNIHVDNESYNLVENSQRSMMKILFKWSEVLKQKLV